VSGGADAAKGGTRGILVSFDCCLGPRAAAEVAQMLIRCPGELHLCPLRAAFAGQAFRPLKVADGISQSRSQFDPETPMSLRTGLTRGG
jgi:hypothetical protein